MPEPLFSPVKPTPIEVLRRALETRHDLAELIMAALKANGFEIVSKTS